MKTVFKITTSAKMEIIKKVGSKPAEQGGVLMGKDGIITDFIHDKHAKTSRGTYELNIQYLNPLIKKLVAQGKEFLGILHSHPSGYAQLSSQDRTYFKSQFKNFPDLDKMFTPIVFSAKDGEFHFFPYIFHKSGKIEEVRLEILPDNYEEYLTKKVEVVEKKVIQEKQEQLKTEVIKTEKEVTINFHNEVTQKGELEPVVIFVEREKEVEEKQEEVTEKIIEVVEEEIPLETPILKYIYHGFLIGLLLFVFVMLIFLSPNIHNYFTNLLN